MARVPQADASVTGWRLKIGITLFGLSIVLPVLGVPLVAVLGLSAGVTATVSGALLGGSEVAGLIAVAVMGKSGFAAIKNRVFGFIKQHGPPAEVGRTRYTIGIVMFSVPVVFGWITPYVADLIPGYLGNEFTYGILGDLLFLLSLIVLGGDFWDKLRALFLHGAKAIFPNAVG